MENETKRDWVKTWIHAFCGAVFFAVVGIFCWPSVAGVVAGSLIAGVLAGIFLDDFWEWFANWR